MCAWIAVLEREKQLEGKEFDELKEYWNKPIMKYHN